jgi:CRISPR/Cas system-associated exonuclease Cas4 (RecB family)
MLFNFTHWLLKHQMRSPESCEAKIISGNLMLMGVIDAVLSDENGISLVDYKTSKSPEITSDIQRQAALYALLYQDKYRKTPEKVLVHFLKTPDDPLPIYIDEQLLEYGRIVLRSVHEKTVTWNEYDYPCTCGGYCEQDFT